MKFFLYAWACILLCQPAFAQETCLNETFGSGIPSAFVNLDQDEWPVGTGFRISVKGDWFTGNVWGGNGKVAMSTSRHTVNMPAANWLITPKLTIPHERIWLSWRARSTHHDLRESYRIMVSTTDTDPSSFKELDCVEAEDYNWQHRLLSLADYAGQDIYVAFLHDSQMKFILALDDLFVGEMQQQNLSVDNRTRRFCGDEGTAKVEGTLHNKGMDLPLKSIVCRSGVNEWKQEFSSDTFSTGESVDYAFDIPVTVGEAAPYTLHAVVGENQEVDLLFDQIICSHYPRTLLVEKGTGAWCTACPGVIPYVNGLLERYGKEMVAIEAHSAYSDISNLSYPLYDQGMATSNYPVIYYNRDHTQPQYSASNSTLAAALEKPTVALTDLVVTQSGIDSLDVEAFVTFAQDMDNSQDKYRFGFAVLDKLVQLPYAVQKSNATTLDTQEYAMMASPIPADLMFFHNVVRGTESAFLGIPQSLPAELQAGETYSFATRLAIPETVENPANMSVVVFAMNYFKNEVLNTTEKMVDFDPTVGVKPVKQEDAAIRILHQTNTLDIRFPHAAPYQVCLYSLEGKLLHTWKGEGSTARISLPGNSYAPALLKATQGKARVTRRL